jgi:hypothetical protein
MPACYRRLCKERQRWQWQWQWQWKWEGEVKLKVKVEERMNVEACQRKIQRLASEWRSQCKHLILGCKRERLREKSVTKEVERGE